MLIATDQRWEFWIDRGGTFTDIVARRPDGTLLTQKLLSENPGLYDDAALAGMRRILDVNPDAPLPSEKIAAVKMGTTIATNALLERQGEATALFITRGFRDALRIAYQNRPRIFNRHIVLPEQLYQTVYEVDERIGAHGKVLIALDKSGTQAKIAEARAKGFRSIAIVLMHGYRYTEHEQLIADFARAAGFEQISVSHKVSPLMKLVARGDTTVADAYLSPILRRYVDRVAAQLPGVNLMFMQSSGGLTGAALFQGKDSILSGPAGGIVGAARTSAYAGFSRIIGFDMGGTSTDVSHYAGQYERVFETLVAGVRMRAPMMDIHTVAAGGGSILHFDGARLRVGPDSAGAQPGPACYRRGGPLTVTDCNVLLGKIQPQFFPAVFGANGNAPLDAAVVRERFSVLAGEISTATGKQRTAEDIAEGYLRIAVENMANAIKKISVQRGHDITAYTLVCFGGAAGQHACMVADALAMRRIYIHPHAGVLSAYGMGLADITAMREQAVEATLDAALLPQLDTLFEKIGQAARLEVEQQQIPNAQITLHRRVHLKYQGTDTALIVGYGTPAGMQQDFETEYRKRYSFLMTTHALIVEAVSVEAVGHAMSALEPTVAAPRSTPLTPAGEVNMYSGGFMHRAPLYRRDDLRPGDMLKGPAIVADNHSTTIIEPDWELKINEQNQILIEISPQRAQISSKHLVSADIPDPVMLEIFNNLFMAIAEQMGVTLANTAYSVNIKERLDFSCALFDAQGNLIANAPHMPVHLGSMGESVKTVIADNNGRMQPGDVYMLNDPYHGGTHLPDITVITPVFDDSASTSQILFYVGARGHHADIGGITPGSMPPHSKTIDEEGVLISNFKLVEQSRLREAETRALLGGDNGSSKWPSRNIDQNLADLRAMIAANQKGVTELRRMCTQFGLATVHAYMRHVQDNAEQSVRRVIGVLKDGDFSYEMDHGAVIRVAIRIDHASRSAVINFTGTSPQLANNFNAPVAVTMAAVLYVFRTLVDADIPLNAGCLKPLKVIIPEGSMLNPRPPAAVVAGNVETSQCVTDALYGALGMMGASQGTMNNFTFGNEQYQYYETIAGGSGAGIQAGSNQSAEEGFDGTACVQTHMTNSRLTDPEVLEWRYPVLLESFEIRHGSGGSGRWHGGDGAMRRIRFLEAMTAGILSGHRRVPPYGMAGGKSGAVGLNTVIRRDGAITELNSSDQADMRPGDVFMIETPGGGGYGNP